MAGRTITGTQQLTFIGCSLGLLVYIMLVYSGPLDNEKAVADNIKRLEYENTLRLSHIHLFRELEAEQVERRARIKAMCDVSYINATDDRSLVLPSHRLYYCPIPKTACSSWQTILATIAGDHNEIKKVHNAGYMTDLGFRYSNGTSNLGAGLSIQDYHSFVFVRHPLSRLLSAYLDKFTRDTKYTRYYIIRYGRHIIKTLRPNATRVALHYGNDVTFLEFLRYIITMKRMPWRMDTHWQPQYLLCHFCQVDYDFVGKLEQMSLHGRYILERYIGATEMDILTTNSVNRSSTEQGYYKNIPENIMKEIRDIYQKDFKYFDYDMEVPSW